MTNAIALRGSDLTAAINYADHLAQAALLPENYRRQPANVLYAIEYGNMLGIGVMAAINGIHVIKGKPTASAALVSALVRRAGHRLRVGFDMDTLTGWAEIVRSDDPDYTFRSEWNLQRAVDAELCLADKDGKPFAVSSNGQSLAWKKFFPSMVKSRSITEVARDACEEVLYGLHYTPEELGASIDDDTIQPLPQTTHIEPQPDIEDAEIIEHNSPPPMPHVGGTPYATSSNNPSEKQLGFLRKLIMKRPETARKHLIEAIIGRETTWTELNRDEVSLAIKALKEPLAPYLCFIEAYTQVPTLDDLIELRNASHDACGHGRITTVEYDNLEKSYLDALDRLDLKAVVGSESAKL
jgi:hypothetical protein